MGDAEEDESLKGTIACIRCRIRKIRCDRGFPKCGSCEKLGHACLTKDPTTGRTVPRSYLAHLEKRVEELEKELSERTVQDVSTIYSDERNNPYLGGTSGMALGDILNNVLHEQLAREGKKYPTSVVGQMGPITVPQRPGARSSSQSQTSATTPSSTNNSKDLTSPGSVGSQDNQASPAMPPETGIKGKRKRGRSAKRAADADSDQPSGAQKVVSAQIGDDGLASSAHIPPNNNAPMELPTKTAAEKYLQSYFQRSNPQIPVLHREEFIESFFEPVYGPIGNNVKLADKYTVSDIKRSDMEPPTGSFYRRTIDTGGSLSAVPEPRMRTCLYFLFQAFAIGAACMRGELGTNSAGLAHSLHDQAMQHYTQVISSHDRINALRALLLLGVYSLMRPAHPGVWFVVGTAMRMCIEMGLHNEERALGTTNKKLSEVDTLMLDTGRRLFWCTYVLDRQISVYLGRPTSLDDDYIRVPLFCLADDTWIRPGKSPETAPVRPSYKWVCYYMLCIHRIQQKVKYHFYDRADAAFRSGSRDDREALLGLRLAILSEVENWHESLPRDVEVYNYEVNFLFFELNYHQTLLLLYGVSRAWPNPSVSDMRIILTAGVKILETYVKIYDCGALNYSWVSTHNIFQAAASSLYVLYLTKSLNGAFKLGFFEDLIKQSLDVIESLKEECHAAKWCHQSLEVMSKVTMELLRQESATPKTAKKTRSKGRPKKQISPAPVPAKDQGAIAHQSQVNDQRSGAIPEAEDVEVKVPPRSQSRSLQRNGTENLEAPQNALVQHNLRTNNDNNSRAASSSTQLSQLSEQEDFSNQDGPEGPEGQRKRRRLSNASLALMPDFWRSMTGNSASVQVPEIQELESFPNSPGYTSLVSRSSVDCSQGKVPTPDIQYNTPDSGHLNRPQSQSPSHLQNRWRSVGNMGHPGQQNPQKMTPYPTMDGLAREIPGNIPHSLSGITPCDPGVANSRNSSPQPNFSHSSGPSQYHPRSQLKAAHIDHVDSNLQRPSALLEQFGEGTFDSGAQDTETAPYDYINEMSQMLIWDSFTLPPTYGQ